MRPLGPVHIPGPRIHEALISYDSIKFRAWDMARPEREVDCCGLNERQAIDHAAIQLGVPGWRIRLRPALPSVTELPCLRLA
jgi:hypothetical protein